jgi:succinate dehydrogenase / fumarate reductase flavoprotein subunit
VFGKRAGEFAAEFARDHPALPPDGGEVNEAVRDVLAPFDRPTGESPYAVQHDLQDMMQSLAGIVRTESEMIRALEGLVQLRRRAATVGVTGNREFNPGWHTALDLRHLLTVSEAIVTAALARKESRGGHFRDDFPEKRADFAGFNFVLRPGADGGMDLDRAAIPPLREDLRQLVEEFK